MNLVLCGHACSGKTTYAQALKLKYGYDVIDTDAWILQSWPDPLSSQASIPEIYAEHGEKIFRRVESEVIQRISHQITDDTTTVIATGGGSVLYPENVSCLSSCGLLFYLYVRYDILCSRWLSREPWPYFIDLHDPKRSAKHHWNARHSVYDRVCDVTLDISDQTLEEVVLLIKKSRVHIYGE